MKPFKYLLVLPSLSETVEHIVARERSDDEVVEVNLLDVHNDIGLIDRKALESASRQMMSLSQCDQFQSKSFYLSPEYDWVLGITSGNRIVLVPIDPKRPSINILKQLEDGSRDQNT